MKIIYTIIPFIFLFGCTTGKINIPKTVLDNCNGVTPYWYGEKGVSPVDNDVWKCYSWEILGID